MWLTLSIDHPEADALGFLLHKHPDRAQSFDLSFGQAHVFYPTRTATRCTAALLVEVDPVRLSRGAPGQPQPQQALEPYVNDRPYVASSLLSVAIAQVLRSALQGRCPTHPELPVRSWPLTLTLAALPVRGGDALLRALFEPLGYQVQARALALDPTRPQWGDSACFEVTLSHTLPVAQALAHLYVLIPVLDADKHYFIGAAEVDKLLRHGAGWLPDHPARELITRRYLKRRSSLIQEADQALTALATLEALDALAAPDDPDDALADDDAAAPSDAEPLVEPSREVASHKNLHQTRLLWARDVLVQAGCQRVLDLGCGEGKLLKLLLQAPQLTQIVGVDVSIRQLQVAVRRLKYDRMAPRLRERLTLRHGSLLYRDAALAGFDGAALIEVIEHLEPHRLGTFERVVFEAARPRVIALTSPNQEYNALFEGMAEGAMRHADHRFEWTRAELEAWASRVATTYGYAAHITPLGPVDPQHGAPTQGVVFTRIADITRDPAQEA